MQFTETSEGYEKLAQEIYHNIITLEGIENIDVNHNVKIKGKSCVNHQIDVFWEYKYAGVSHKILIECKYYKNPVSLLHARNMLGLITDIPNSQGILVTTQGYQSGVSDFCSHYGINLKIIRPPLGSDWDGCIRIVNINGILYQNEYLDIKFELDGKDHNTVRNVGSQDNIVFNPYEIFIQEDNSQPVFIGKWLDKHIVSDTNFLGIEKETIITPNLITFIVLHDKRLLKLKCVNVKHILKKREMFITIDDMDFVRAVLQDFSSGKIEYTLTKNK